MSCKDYSIFHYFRVLSKYVTMYMDKDSLLMHMALIILMFCFHSLRIVYINFVEGKEKGVDKHCGIVQRHPCMNVHYSFLETTPSRDVQGILLFALPHNLISSPHLHYATQSPPPHNNVVSKAIVDMAMGSVNNLAWSRWLSVAP